MRSPRFVAGVVAAVALAAGVLGLWLGPREGAAGSALSRGPRGWVVARRYVEARGLETRLRRRPAEPVPPGAILVLALPLQRWPSNEALETFRRHVRLGGTLVLGYAGGPFDPAEDHVLGTFGLHLEETTTPSLHPWRWRREMESEWALVPEGGDARLGTGRIRRLPRAPRMPATAEVLHRNEGGRPLTASLPLGTGRILLLPAEALSNARLHRAGHGALLENLIDETGGIWLFDEYHHGLSAPTDPMLQPALRAFDLWMVHAVLVYVLAVLALARRFGPAWREPPVTAGSPGAFFLGLGALAGRLGLHREAGELLVARARELDPKTEIGAEDLPEPDDETHFLELARVVARVQQRRTR